MKTLFTDSEGTPLRKEINIEIIPAKDKALSKNQALFNKLVVRIKNLNKNIESEKLRLDTMLQEYSKHIPHLEKKLAESEILMAKNIGKAAKSMPFTPKQKKEIQQVICWICNDAFSKIEPDKETRDFYNTWADKSYEDDIEEQKKDLIGDLSNEVKSRFGVDIDFSDIDDTPEGFARLQEKLKNFAEQQKEKEQEAFSNRRKTKKQLEKESVQEQEEALKLKSIRSIYISLVKMLHPDTVVDDAEKLRNEELMKKITVAYTNNDIATLLKFEMEWIWEKSNDIETLTEEKLKHYISALKDQISELQMERSMLYNHPRYYPIMRFTPYTKNQALKFIENETHELETRIFHLENRLHNIQTNFSQNTIWKYVTDVLRLIKIEEEDNYFDIEKFFS